MQGKIDEYSDIHHIQKNLSSHDSDKVISSLAEITRNPDHPFFKDNACLPSLIKKGKL
jgi:hypothetical protein